MTTKEIKERLLKIVDLSKTDNERAHCSEDSLFSDFVEAIANGKYNTLDEVKECAELVLKTCEIDYEKWYS